MTNEEISAVIDEHAGTSLKVTIIQIGDGSREILFMVDLKGSLSVPDDKNDDDLKVEIKGMIEVLASEVARG